jgi:predicted TIM-barrel fold metal-dependent hydrolase
LLQRLRASDDLWVKISGAERLSAVGPPFTDAAPFGAACIEAAPDRCIWGTDWPHPNVRIMPNDGDLVDIIPEMMPDSDMQRRILVDNPACLFGF